MTDVQKRLKSIYLQNALNFDCNIVNQSEIEYGKAKPPFIVKHVSQNGDVWYTSHCPVCMWDDEYGLWDCMIDIDVKYCRRCGQKIDWEI